MAVPKKEVLAKSKNMRKRTNGTESIMSCLPLLTPKPTNKLRGWKRDLLLSGGTIELVMGL